MVKLLNSEARCVVLPSVSVVIMVRAVSAPELLRRAIGGIPSSPDSPSASYEMSAMYSSRSKLELRLRKLKDDMKGQVGTSGNCSRMTGGISLRIGDPVGAARLLGPFTSGMRKTLRMSSKVFLSPMTSLLPTSLASRPEVTSSARRLPPPRNQSSLPSSARL